MSNNNARINMVSQQLRTGDVLKDTILDLFEQVPRHEFVPEQYIPFAYSDMQIPLAFGQRMLTPLEEGTILQALNLSGTESVLEIGTGTGFFTALLSKMCKEVLSVDYFPDFTKNTESKLKKHNIDNVTLVTGDGCQGWLEKAPYDVVVFTGAIEKLKKTHFLQVIPGGKLVAITGKAPVMKAHLFECSPEEEWQETLLFETLIPELIDQLRPKEFVF